MVTQKHLFSPLNIRDTTFRNRIFMSPMCQYSAEDGLANDWHLTHLGSRAAGGAGGIIFEASAILPEGRISWADLGIWNDSQVDALRPVVGFVRNAGSVPVVQLAHAGRKASVGRPWDAPGWESQGSGSGGDRTWEPVSPTGRRFSDTSPVPRILSTADVRGIVRAFESAAHRSVDAGFQAVEIHAAHGYLIHQFLSPLCNDRTDQYGGAFENRIRLLKETCGVVRNAVGQGFPVFVRISATDWHEDGWSVDDSVKLASVLRDIDIDLVDCSSGGIIPDLKIPAGSGYQVPLASRLRSEAGIATGAVGLITSPAQADQIVRTGQADVVIVGRELLRDPHWPWRAARALGADIQTPPQYLRAW